MIPFNYSPGWYLRILFFPFFELHLQIRSILVSKFCLYFTLYTVYHPFLLVTSKKNKIITIFWIITSWNKFPGKIAQSPISVSSSYTYIILLIWVFYNLILFPRFWKIKPQQAMKILTNNFQWTLWNFLNTLF